MHFINSILFAATALATMAAATNTVHFVNQDSKTRTIYFTCNPGQSEIDSLEVPGSGTADQIFPEGWIGNFYSVTEGAPNIPGSLGELTWGGYGGINFFDVSSIVMENPLINDGVKQIYPANSKLPVSGCQTTPCESQYNAPDDLATLSTEESELVCLIGDASEESSTYSRRHARDFSS